MHLPFFMLKFTQYKALEPLKVVSYYQYGNDEWIMKLKKEQVVGTEYYEVIVDR